MFLQDTEHLCEYFASHFATQHQNRICFHEQLHSFPYFPVEGPRSPRAGPCYQMQISVLLNTENFISLDAITFSLTY